MIYVKRVFQACLDAIIEQVEHLLSPIRVELIQGVGPRKARARDAREEEPAAKA